MATVDRFSHHYSELLDQSYDCVDRIILNGYFRMGCSPGGFRNWWRSLYGNDDNLNNASLQRFSGRFSRRLRAYAEHHGIPVVSCKAGDDRKKHIIADSYLPTDPEFVGLFLVIIGRAPGMVWDIARTQDGRIGNIGRKKSKSWVNHFSFHIMDPEWGHVTFKICGQPPFAAQIMLNGHEYVARQTTKNRLKFTKEDNCFTSFSSGPKMAKIAGTLRSQDAVGQLTQLCDRWIYSSCLYFALFPEEQEKSRFHYDYSVYQLEYSRNLIFHRGTELERVFQGVIDKTRSTLDIKTVKTLFGYKKRQKFHRGGKRNRMEVVIEGPEYDLMVFKVHFGKLTLKAYTKGERVLRIEAIVHNVNVLRCRRSLPNFPEIADHLQRMVGRFMDALACVNVSSIKSKVWDTLRNPSYLGASKVPGIDISKPRMRASIEAAIALSIKPGGFSVKDLTTKITETSCRSKNQFSQANVAYNLRKLRAKKFVEKIPGSIRYQWTNAGLQAMAALLVITDKVIKPVLAEVRKPSRRTSQKQLQPTEIHYQNLKNGLIDLFHTLGVAA